MMTCTLRFNEASCIAVSGITLLAWFESGTTGEGEITNDLKLTSASHTGKLNIKAPKEQGEETEGKDCVLAATATKDYLVTCDDYKQLKVWKLDGSLQLLSTRALARRCTAVCVSGDGEWILAADKSGDVYKFPLLGESQTVPPTEGEEMKTGELVLGHLSMLMDVEMVGGDQYVATCDRDERIRVSRFPNAYNVQAFCLGHTDFVKTLCYCQDTEILFSGGADGRVCMWSPLDGRLLSSFDVAPLLASDLTSGDQETSGIVSQVTWVRETSTLVAALDGCQRLILLKLEVCKESRKCKVVGSHLTSDLGGPVWHVAIRNRSDVYALGDFGEDTVLKALRLPGADVWSGSSGLLELQACDDDDSQHICKFMNSRASLFIDDSKKRMNLARLRKAKIDSTVDYYERKQQRIESQEAKKRKTAE